MKYIIVIFFILYFLNFSLKANEYQLSWYPKDKYFDSIKTPDNTKYSLINTAGVWEDNQGSYGIMKCLVTLFTLENQNTSLNGFCEANDANNIDSKFWLTLKRDSFETAGVGKMTYVSGTGIYKKVIGMSCPYAVIFLDDYGIIKQKCSKEFYEQLKNNN